MSVRNIVATLAGVTAYVWTLYRFLPYSERNELPVSTYQTFALAFGANIVQIVQSRVDEPAFKGVHGLEQFGGSGTTNLGCSGVGKPY